MKNPKVGQYVFDIHYQRRRKVMGVPKGTNTLYYIGEDHDPVYRYEFLFPLPKNPASKEEKKIREEERKEGIKQKKEVQKRAKKGLKDHFKMMEKLRKEKLKNEKK
ncbi:MAG: hypothetical protein LBR79_02580 [Oscillospiraceae bacterium]|jgi:hypothetical protein|nr:hypothetical protein [Oscillospiraceae bacterium]